MRDQLASHMTFDDTGRTESEQTSVTQADVAPVDFPDLIARCMGNLAFAERILTKFERRFDDDLVQLQKEISRRDAEGIARVAHRLKGASANVSANGLRDIFSRLEQLGRMEQLPEVPACMEELGSEWSRFKAQIQWFASAGETGEFTVATD